MKSLRLTLKLTTAAAAALAVGQATASSFIGFETVGPNAATDGLILADQYRPTMGIRFSRLDGGNVELAQSGAPYTAFAAGTDASPFASGDTVLDTDPWAAAVGKSFVRLAGTPGAALIIQYDYPTAAAAGLLLDVDSDETWVVRAYSDAGTTLVAETVIRGGTAGTGDQTATPWAIGRPSADIVQLRILQTGNNANAGAALDLFHPYGTFSDVGTTPEFRVVQNPGAPVQFQLAAIPGQQIRIDATESLGSGNWTVDRTFPAVLPVTEIAAGSTASSPGRFLRAASVPLVDRAATIYAAVQGFLATLTDAERTAIVYAANNTTQRAKWSNFPTGIFQRNGLKIGLMSTTQVTALWSMLAAVLSPEGFQKVSRIVSADDLLAGSNYGTKEYYVSFVGTPSPTGKYLLQFGGHHLALNITIKGDQATIAPALPGVQPGTYTYNGRTVRPLGDEYDLSFALLNSLSAAQRSAAVLGSTVIDLVLGPGKDGATVLPEGIKASDLSTAQRAILLDLIGKYVNIIHDDASRAKMATIRANLADTTNPTYFSWRGPTTAGSAAYFRIQGPNLFIEFSPQTLGGSAVNHTHAMYREIANDYGTLIPE